MSMQSRVECMSQIIGQRWQLQSAAVQQLKHKMPFDILATNDAVRQLGQDVRVLIAIMHPAVWTLS